MNPWLCLPKLPSNFGQDIPSVSGQHVLALTASQAVKGGIVEFIGLTQKGKEYLLQVKAITK